MKTKLNCNFKYTGLEHRQTLRACTLIVIYKLKSKMDNLKFGKKIGNLVGKGLKF